MSFRLPSGPLAVLTLLCACVTPGGDSPRFTLYRGGPILTMEGAPGSVVQAVVTEGDRIVFAGDLAQARSGFSGAHEVDLAGRTLMPGFIEQHLHPFLGGIFLTMPIVAPEAWELPERTWKAAPTPEAYRASLAEQFGRHADKDAIFWCWGYHSYFHGELVRADLDALSTTTPIAVWHRSCHEFLVNSAFLRRFGVDAADVASASETARAQIDLEKGHFYENGAMVYLLPKIMGELAAPERLSLGLRRMVTLLHHNGVTAFNEPGALMDPAIAQLYREILGAEDVPLLSTFLVEGNTLFMAKGAESLAVAEETLRLLPSEGKVRFLPGHIKFLADGAIISQLMQMKDGYLDGHSGEWMLAPELLEAATKLFWEAGYQLHIHVNGDLGLEVVLATIARRMQEHPRADHRTVIVHFANSTEEQVRKLAELGCVVSANPYYVTGFADKYSEIGLGRERASAMARLAPLEALGVSVSLHSDLPMAPADPLYLAWCAATRRTNEGNVARPDLALGRHAALRGITIDAAHSWRMEDELGSIRPGKQANFTLLDGNPYAVELERLADIEVVATVFAGRLYPVER